MTQTTGIVRILKHPHDPVVVLLDIPVNLNDLARQLPAELAPDLRGWVMHNESIPALYRWANHNDIHVTDDRTPAKTHSRPTAQPMPECTHCAQPAQAAARLTHCPSCGSPWQPVVHHHETIAHTKTPCPECGHQQAGRFAYCSRCGAGMVYPEPDAHPQITRVNLEDPMTLGEALAELPLTNPRDCPP